MLQKKLKLLKNEAGLTLVELLAVIVILGVIAAIAVPTIGGLVSDTKVKADEQSVTLIKDAAERYLTIVDPDGNGKLADGTTVVPGLSGTGPYTVLVSTLATEGYLKTAPKNQADGKSYANVSVAFNAKSVWEASAVATQ